MNCTAQSSCVPNVPRAEQIARLNDKLRTTATGGTVLITSGIRNLGEFNPLELLHRLAAYQDFDADSDPHGERDFGAMDLWSAELLWKIDYYAPDLMFGSEDPADPTKTHRVLTVMLAEEY
ncbi:hypothetical protein GCM10023264_10810 [Sphingomonas daechungensis]|uniref:DUF3768 domain-containing protein n=1 Tax=Sphingomonas daechungensis TaxID=1176646 RepID=A0ABX6TAC8_9SPHN|nr:DUF3768 domain-containing protein [Sphingomonas daechungensis]QNP44598.1 DUF3768 domain-containing protein [Sphingomonas daechungensis]